MSLSITIPLSATIKPKAATTIKPLTPKQKRELNKIDPLLLDILSTKRPTNNPVQNLAYMTQLLDSLNICYPRNY